MLQPYYAFKEAGYDVTIASVAGGPIPIDTGSMKGDFFTADAKKFMHDAEAFNSFSHSKKLDPSMGSQYDAVFVSGGHGCCVDMEGPAHAALKSIIEAQYARGAVVACDCHGPYALIECKKPDGSPLVAGLEVTGFSDSEERGAGAYDWVVGAGAKLIEQEFIKQGAKYHAAAGESNASEPFITNESPSLHMASN